jgi:hypothetical protein
MTSATSVQLNQYSLPDPYLGCTAWTFVAPAGWQIEGGVGWTGHMSPAYYTTLTVGDPSGTEQFTLFPTFIFSTTPMPMGAGGMNEVRPVADPLTCVREVILPRCRPEIRDWRVLGTERLPQVAAAVADRARPLRLPGLRTDSARVHIEYRVPAFEVEEMFYCTIVSSRSLLGTIWCNERTHSCRAAKGGLEAALPVLGTIAASLQENPQWVVARQQRLNQLVQSMSAPPLSPPGSRGPSILDVSRSMARDQDEFLRGVDASFAARLNSPGLNAWTAAQRGITGMENPVTGEHIDVPNGYLRYFQTNLGEVFGTNNMIDDPYVTYHINATELR